LHSRRFNEKQWEARPYFAENGSEARRQIFALLCSALRSIWFHRYDCLFLVATASRRFVSHIPALLLVLGNTHKNTQKHNTTAAAPARGLLLGQAFEEDVIRVLTSSIIWRERNAQYRA
jgi:hypothetical protein